MDWAGMGWAGLGWTGIGWAGLSWYGLCILHKKKQYSFLKILKIAITYKGFLLEIECSKTNHYEGVLAIYIDFR